MAKLDRRISLQLIFHALCQDHQDPKIIEALRPLANLAEEFRQKYHPDAPELPSCYRKPFPEETLS